MATSSTSSRQLESRRSQGFQTGAAMKKAAGMMPSDDAPLRRGTVVLPPMLPVTQLLGKRNLEQPLLHSAGASEDVSTLPDLTDRIYKAGLYPQYLEFRDGYMKWRRGGGHGARGEPTTKALTLDPRRKNFDFWYPKYHVFKLRQTLSFWICVTYLEGSVLFCYTSVLSIIEGDLPDFACNPMMSSMPNLGGATFYTIGAYLYLFEIINLPNKDSDDVSFFTLRLDEVLKLVPWPSITGSSSYFVGAMLYQVAMVVSLIPDVSESWIPLLVTWPLVFGGVLFCMGGFCEVMQNEVLKCNKLPSEPVWWVSVLNLIGGIFFTLGAIPMAPLIGWSAWLYLLGSVCFTVTSVLSLVMWRGEEFGLALIPMINVHHPEVPTEELSPQSNPVHEREPKLSLSSRGLAFICVSAIAGACASLNCYCSFLVRRWGLHAITDFIYNLVHLLLTHMFLMLQSATVTVPKEQPHHFLMIALRYVLALVLLNCMLRAAENLQSCFH